MSRKKRKENCNKYRKNQQQGEQYLRLVSWRQTRPTETQTTPSTNKTQKL